MFLHFVVPCFVLFRNVLFATPRFLARNQRISIKMAKGILFALLIFHLFLLFSLLIYLFLLLLFLVPLSNKQTLGVYWHIGYSCIIFLCVFGDCFITPPPSCPNYFFFWNWILVLLNQKRVEIHQQQQELIWWGDSSNPYFSSKTTSQSLVARIRSK